MTFQRKRFNKSEYAVYAIIYVVMVGFVAVSSWYHGSVEHDDTTTLILKDFLGSLKMVSILFVALIIHDLLLAPLLIYKHKVWQYTAGVIILVGLFLTYQLTLGRPNRQGTPPPMVVENGDSLSMMPSMPAQAGDSACSAPIAPPPPEAVSNAKAFSPRQFPPPPAAKHDLLTMLLLMLGIGSNLGIKLYFYTLEGKRKLSLLEKENMEQKLAQLKYQLHPHFFMNTLNNIHALVDIDSERAKASIISLSKLMRYVLYESNNDMVPLAKEKNFMENYVGLMKMRYSEKLSISIDTHDDKITNLMIAPLIFVSFVENAFKHGVDYNKKSFIDISARIEKGDAGQETRLIWKCRNSKAHGKKNPGTKLEEAHGVGLTNIKRRLDLIYGTGYTLNIRDLDDEFIVELNIPLMDGMPTSTGENNSSF